QTAGEFADDLRRWLRSEPTVANPPWPPRRIALWARRNPEWAAMAGLACAGLIGVGGLLLEVQRQKTGAAQARAETAEGRASEAEAGERILEGRWFEQAVLESQQTRLGVPAVGWSGHAWGKLEAARAIRPDPVLRDHAAATLVGLDARHDPVALWK